MKIFECDVDGVLLDIYTPVDKYMQRQDSSFSCKDRIHTWSMRELGVHRKPVLDLLLSEQVRNDSDFYPNVDNFILGLCTLAKVNGGLLVFNSHEMLQSSAKVKYKKLKAKLESLGISNDIYTINISCGVKKEMLKSFVVIDDALPNIEQSSAQNKILFGLFHNDPCYNRIPEDCVRLCDYADILRHISVLCGDVA